MIMPGGCVIVCYQGYGERIGLTTISPNKPSEPTLVSSVVAWR